MLRLVTTYVGIALLCLALAGGVCSDTMWDYQEVNENGLGIHTKVNAPFEDPANKVVVEGIALAGSDEILNPDNGERPAYTLFVQDDVNPRGGIQAWAGAWFYEMLWPILRTTDYIDVNGGDRVRITGFLADAGRGKVVINNRHSNNLDLVFHVEILGHPGLPDPELIPSVSHCNYFDMTRSGGGEYYQTRFVMLHGVDITSGTWGNNNMLTVTDETGSVGALLSLMGNYSQCAPPEGKLSFVAIFDQEDTVFPHTEGYRLWVKKCEDVALAVDSCRQAKSYEAGIRVALIDKVVSRVYDGYFYIQDTERSGGVRVDSNRSVSPGQLVAVHGVISEDGGEKAIVPTHLSPGSQASIRPVFATGPTLRAESGLDVYGLLVRCVVTIGTDRGDGLYSCTDDSGNEILVDANGISLPDDGKLVVLTAVVAQRNGEVVLLVNDESDIQILN